MSFPEGQIVASKWLALGHRGPEQPRLWTRVPRGRNPCCLERELDQRGAVQPGSRTSAIKIRCAHTAFCDCGRVGRTVTERHEVIGRHPVPVNGLRE